MLPLAEYWPLQSMMYSKNKNYMSSQVGNVACFWISCTWSLLNRVELRGVKNARHHAVHLLMATIIASAPKISWNAIVLALMVAIIT